MTEQRSLDNLQASLNTELTRTIITYKNPHKLIAISKLKQLTRQAWFIALEIKNSKVSAGTLIPRFIKQLNRLTRYAIKNGLLKEAPTLEYETIASNGFTPITGKFTPLSDNSYSAKTLAAALEHEHNPDRMLSGLIISWGKQTTPKIIPAHVQP